MPPFHSITHTISEEVKAHLETQDCTFVPAILETPTVDEGALLPAKSFINNIRQNSSPGGSHIQPPTNEYMATPPQSWHSTQHPTLNRSSTKQSTEIRAALPIWERLHLEQTERASRKEHRRLAFEEQAKAKMPFKPAILGALFVCM